MKIHNTHTYINYEILIILLNYGEGSKEKNNFGHCVSSLLT